MDYNEWYNEGVTKDYLRFYTLKTFKDLLDNMNLMKQAFTKSVEDKLDNEVIEQIYDEGDLYWINLQLDIMAKKEFWEDKVIE